MQISKLKVKLGIFLFIALVIFECLLFNKLSASVNEARAWEMHTLKVITELESLYSNIGDAQNGQLGYILYGKKEYLKPYEEILGNIPYTSFLQKNAWNHDNLILKNIKNLRELVQDNFFQQEKLNQIESLILAELEIIRNNIALYNKSGFEATVKNLRSSSDNSLRLQVRDKIAEMIHVEEALFVKRSQVVEMTRHRIVSFIFVAAGLTYAALGGVIILLLQARKRLNINQDRLNRAIRGTSDGLWDWDLQTNEVYYSKRFKEILEFSDVEMKNTIEAFTERLHSHDVKKMWDAVKAHLNVKTSYDIEVRVLTKNNHYIWTHIRGQAIWGQDNKPIRMSGFISDISQRKEVERFKNEFISTVSHELRTPLTAIRGSLGLMLCDVGGNLSVKTHNLVEIAHKNCERLILLINDMLDMEKISSGQMRYEYQLIDIKPFLQQAVLLNQSYAQKFGVQFLLKGIIPSVQVKADNDRLMQVMANLMSNAAKFSPEDADIEISAFQNGGKIRIAVKDYGSGIPTEFHSRIFDKFAQADSSNTRQKGGTGLGLNISKALIEKFGGKIGFESEKDKGTLFYFDLPIVFMPDIEQADNLQKGKKTILVCEDDVDIAHYLKKIFEEQNFNVDIAFNARDAKKLLKTKEYFALTLDLLLPDEHGIDVLKELRRNPSTKDLPVIVISAKAEESEKKPDGDILGIIDWLCKPIDQKRLVLAINRIPIKMKDETTSYFVKTNMP